MYMCRCEMTSWFLIPLMSHFADDGTTLNADFSGDLDQNC